MQHNVHKKYDAGIICDSHLKATFVSLDWSEHYSDTNNVAHVVEGWLPKEYYFDANPVFVSNHDVYANI